MYFFFLMKFFSFFMFSCVFSSSFGWLTVTPLFGCDLLPLSLLRLFLSNP